MRYRYYFLLLGEFEDMIVVENDSVFSFHIGAFPDDSIIGTCKSMGKPDEGLIWSNLFALICLVVSS